ncbi:alginate O-acetyltransferase AlgX-related protein [Tropicimonas sediminicola]|uniref:Alginate O-acetyltransferase complex protein AlgJ n=1 Tax=Tropicimonas sediminicola TaxID=1031541 RepID=A0A239MK65_9RHOB|nr:hypothetical protein [Tropicimonas sediminicola]SNT42534.1 alginate O-acetyltransferase complex protein AlgJ [Tropicimonas sediminicola]
MTDARLALKLILPVAFFGYAGYANLDLIRHGDLSIADRDLFQGGVTGEIDSVYRDKLPHRDPSVGLVGALRYALLGEGRDGVVVGQDDWLFTTEEYRFAADAPVGLEETVARMAGMRAELAAAGSELVVLPLPAKVDIERRHGSDGAVSRRSAAEYDAFLAALEGAGLQAVDPRAAYAGGEAPGRFFRTDTHWTPETAGRVARHLAATGLVAAGEVSYVRQPGAAETFQGDLVSFVTSDRLAPVIGLAPERAVPYLAVAAEEDAEGGVLDLFGGESGGALVLVGTSYSANPTWSFAEALKLALGRDVLNHAAEGQGPVRPMQAFLAALRAGEAVPEVVVWEFPVRYLADPALWDGDGDAADGAAEEERHDA